MDWRFAKIQFLIRIAWYQGVAFGELQTASDNSRGRKDGTIAFFKSFEKNKKKLISYWVSNEIKMFTITCCLMTLA